jgi:hypothetical protein
MGFGGKRWSLLETVQSYSGSLHRRYAEALTSLNEEGLVPHDFKIKAFLKADKIHHPKLTKPRMIFPRSPRYNLVVASWLKPLEHWLWGNLTSRRLFGGSNTRVVMKGLSPRQRANVIVRKFRNFRECVVFEVDGKAFEAHVGTESLKAEHKVYTSAYGSDRRLARLLRVQECLSGRTEGGWEFSRPGGRASGDVNTGMGNSLLMLAVVVGVLRGFPGLHFDVAVDGDNALLFMEADRLDEVVSEFPTRALRHSGQEVVLERPVRIIEQIRFGRSAPVDLGPGRGWTMVRELNNVLSGMCSSHIHLRHAAFAPLWLRGVAMCELSLARGVPVLQAVTLKLLQATETRKAVKADFYRDYFYVGAWLAGRECALPVHADTRASFWRAFGVDPEEQVRLEGRSLAGLGYQYEGVVPPDPDWFAAWPGSVERVVDEHL